MENFRKSLFLGVLLHDIGKIWQRADHKYAKHDKLSAEAVNHIFQDETMMAIAAYHHKKEFSDAIQNGSLTNEQSILAAAIAGEADNLASGERESNPILVAERPLESIFNGVSMKDTKEQQPDFYQPMCSLNPDNYQFPVKAYCEGINALAIKL